MAWLSGAVEPDLVRLAEYSVSPGAHLSPVEIREALERQIDHAIEVVERVASGQPELTAEARRLHGLPPPEPVAKHLQGLSLDELTARRDALMEQWDAAWSAAEYQADVRAEMGIDPPIAGLRRDMHPSVVNGLSITITRPLTQDEINALIAGRAADGSKIEGKVYAIERQMPDDEKTGERKWSHPIGSFDFCPTPDKSISVAWAFAPEVEQAQIFNAHVEAAREAVAHIAERVGVARTGKGGMGEPEPGHVAWMEFTHHTSRRTMVSVENGEAKVVDGGIAGDPDLHTHFLMPNAVFCDSGRVGSLDTAAIKGFIFEADGVYHARLGQKLRDVGFEVELDERTGAARMPVIPDDIRALFSKRTNIGEALARQWTASKGEQWDDLTDDQRAARIKNFTQDLDQKIKGGKDDVANFEDWKRQAKELGWQPQSLQIYGPQLPRLVGEERDRKAYEIGLPWLDEKLQRRAVITHYDLRVAALRGMVATGMDAIADIGRVTKLMWKEGVSQYGERTEIIYAQEQEKRHVSVTTGLHEKNEKEFVQLARTAAADRSGAIPVDLLKRAVAASGLDFNDDHGKRQLKVIEQLAAGGRFGVAVGTAGAGKTAMLKPLVAAWKEQDRKVYGASLSWRQADDLTASGMAQRDVKAFSVLMDGLKDGSIKADRDTVIAVDELGLLGTRQGLELLRYREQYNFMIIALGDDKQCQSIEAGATIDLVRRALGADQVPEILTTKRQQTEREREIVGLFREGKAADALGMKRADGTAEMAFGGRAGVVKRVAEIYAERLQATGQAPTISAPTNLDAHQISEAVRAERCKLGMVGPNILRIGATDDKGAVYSLSLAKGDRVRLYRSTRADLTDGTRRSIGRNGSVLEVVDVNQDDGVIVRRHDTGQVGLIYWSDLRDKNGRARLGYGDAMTINTAQGSTANEHIIALPSGSQAVTGNQAYVGGTRHRTLSYLVTSETAERLAVRESRPLNDPHEITIGDKWANVAKNFITQTKTDGALNLFDKVNELRRGTVKAFHQARRPTDPRQQPGPAHAHHVAQQRKVDTVMTRVIQHSMQIAQEHVRSIKRGMGMSL